MRLRIEQAIRVTKPCSSASQVLSENSDLYGPLKAPVFAYRATKTYGTNLFVTVSQFSVSTHIFYSKVDFLASVLLSLTIMLAAGIR